MSYFEAIILGIVQGATEFLPISSSAHLLIVPALAGWDDPGPAFTAVVQLGTLAAILSYFWADVLRIAKAWIGEQLAGTFWQSLDARLGWMVIIATVPIVVAGLTLKKLIEKEFRSLWVIAAMLIGVGLLMLVAELFAWRRRQTVPARDMEHVHLGDAVAVGLAQALALVPGTSRSGITIVAGLFRGLTREAAARFSFLLSIPAVFAAAVHQLIHEREALLGSQDGASHAAGGHGRVGRRRLPVDRPALGLCAPPRHHRVRRLPAAAGRCAHCSARQRTHQRRPRKG